MFLRHVKNILPEEALRLRAANEKRKILISLKDSAFLCKALDCDRTNLKAGKNLLKKFEVAKDIGFFEQIEYEIGAEFLNFGYRKTKLVGVGKSLSFVLDQPAGTAAYFNENLPCVDMKIVEKQKDISLFYSGLYYPEGFTGRLNGVSQWGNIISLAQFFNNKRNLYQKIQEVLVENKEEFSSVTNHFFVEDLISLFSVTATSKKVLAFSIPKENIKKRLYLGPMVKVNKTLISEAFYYSDKKTEPTHEEKFPLYAGELWLDSKDRLIIESRSTQTFYPPSGDRIKAAEKDVEYEKFLCRINDWAEQYIAMIDFAWEIYEKVKGKILVSTI
jgi:hypothetical protein